MNQVKLPEIDRGRGLKEFLKQFFRFWERGRVIREMANVPNLRRRLRDLVEKTKEKVKKGNFLVRGCVTDGVGVRLKEGIERGSQLFIVTRALDPVNQSSPALWVAGVFFELVIEDIVLGDGGWWKGVCLRFRLDSCVEGIEGIEDFVGRLSYVAGRRWFSHHICH